MLLAESLRPVPFCPQNPNHALREMPLAKRGSKHAIPAANLSVSLLLLKTKHFLALFGKKAIFLFSN